MSLICTQRLRAIKVSIDTRVELIEDVLVVRARSVGGIARPDRGRRVGVSTCTACGMMASAGRGVITGALGDIVVGGAGGNRVVTSSTANSAASGLVSATAVWETLVM